MFFGKFLSENQNHVLEDLQKKLHVRPSLQCMLLSLLSCLAEDRVTGLEFSFHMRLVRFGVNLYVSIVESMKLNMWSGYF